MKDEVKRRQWYMQEAERIIADADEDLLVEILKVRDAACALYAKETMQMADEFEDSAVVAWLDQKANNGIIHPQGESQ